MKTKKDNVQFGTSFLRPNTKVRTATANKGWLLGDTGIAKDDRGLKRTEAGVAHWNHGLVFGDFC